MLTKDVKLKDYIVSLFSAHLQKRKEWITMLRKKSNMISVLEGMKEMALDCNMRNTIEIKKFFEFNVDALTRQIEDKTITFFPRHRLFSFF